MAGLLYTVPGISIPGVELELLSEDWTHLKLTVGRTPASINKIGGNSHHWRPWAEEKKGWQGELEGLLMASALRRGEYQRAIAGARMSFDKKRRRDSGNLGAIVEKSLGDALVNGRWLIPDDTAEHYCFLGVEFEPERGLNQTVIELFLSTH